MQCVDKLRQRLIDRQTFFELAAPPSYKDFFADSYGSVSISVFICTFFPALKSDRLAWTQHVLIVWTMEFEVLKFLS